MNMSWSEILKILIPNLKSVKDFSKSLAKILVKYILKLSGPQGFITSLILEKCIKWGLVEIENVVQKIKDDHLEKNLENALKEGDKDKIKDAGKKVLEG